LPNPDAEGVLGKLPSTVRANGVTVDFTKELQLFGIMLGYKVNVTEDSGRSIGSGIRVYRGLETDILDKTEKRSKRASETNGGGNESNGWPRFISLNLSLLSPHSLGVTVHTPQRF